jgi:hypothetical protein
MNLTKPTYCVKKIKYRKIPWEYFTKVGQTMMILFDSKENLRSCKNSAARFRRKTRMALRLTCQTSTYLVYELKDE